MRYSLDRNLRAHYGIHFFNEWMNEWMQMTGPFHSLRILVQRYGNWENDEILAYHTVFDPTKTKKRYRVQEIVNNIKTTRHQLLSGTSYLKWSLFHPDFTFGRISSNVSSWQTYRYKLYRYNRVYVPEPANQFKWTLLLCSELANEGPRD